MKKKYIKIAFLLTSIVFLSSCASQYIKQDTDNFTESNTEKAEYNKKVISAFYGAFKRGDAEKMVSFYHDEVEFEDPAFGKLKGERAKNMWRMLIQKGKETLKVNFSNIKANDNYSTAEWVADYTFSVTGNKVHNEIKANFELKDGKIYRHKDNFDMWKWSSMAIGIPGSILGGTGLFQAKLTEEANKELSKFIDKK